MYRQRIRKMGTVSRPTQILPHSALVLLPFQKCENPVAATDRMMDAMIQVAKLKTTGRLARRVMSQTARQAAPDHEPQDPRAAECGDRGRSEVEATSEGQPDWDTPRTLEELIEIRRALLRNEQPKL